MSASPRSTTIPRWSGTPSRALVARLLHPVFRMLNRPRLGWFGRAAYEFALRCNGVAIGFGGRHGLSAAEERFLRRAAPGLAGGVVLDVGANVGHYAAEVRRLAPTARIVSFEPHPRSGAVLRERLAGTAVEVVPLALGDAEGATELFDFAAADGSTQASLSRDSVGLYGGDLVSHPVRVTTLDAFLAERGIERVDLLKVDTEGFDLNVLRGAARAIAERRIALIQFEFIEANIAARVAMRDFFDALPGYRIARLCLNGDEWPLGPYSVKHCEIFGTQNLIARPAASA